MIFQIQWERKTLNIYYYDSRYLTHRPDAQFEIGIVQRASEKVRTVERPPWSVQFFF